MSPWNNKKIRGTSSLTSFRHDKERVLRRRKYLGFFLVLALTVLLFRTPVEEVLSRVMHVVFLPIASVKQATMENFSDVSYVFSLKKSLYKENARLKDALDALILSGYANDALQKENDELKRALKRYPEHEFMLARVLASAGIAPYDTLVLDVGEKDGIVVGMQVFGDGDFVLGEITQTFGKSAVATLYSSGGNQLTAYIGATSTPTTAYGMGGGNFRAVLPKGVDIAIGDLVDIPSLSPAYLGLVESVVKSEYSSLQEIYFQLPVNLTTLRNVYIAMLHYPEVKSE